MAWESFRASAPPTGPGLFAYAATPGMTVACTNPAALGSDERVPLESYWAALPQPPGMAWSSAGPPPPFLRTQGLVSGQCVHDGPIGYFSIQVNADPDDARTDEIPGDVPLPGWGLHPLDLNIAQRDAWLAANR